MTKGENFNHPRKGSRIKVEPIKDPKHIAAIKALLADKPRDLCLFVLGTNTNLRASDLLRIKVAQVRGLKAMGEIEITEKKTGKTRRITLNSACIKAIRKLLASSRRRFETSEYLFTGQRGRLTVPSVTRLVKHWCKEVGLKGRFGSHTLRKTFGYMHRTVHGTPLPELMYVFNHSNQRHA